MVAIAAQRLHLLDTLHEIGKVAEIGPPLVHLGNRGRNFDAVFKNEAVAGRLVYGIRLRHVDSPLASTHVGVTVTPRLGIKTCFMRCSNGLQRFSTRSHLPFRPLGPPTPPTPPPPADHHRP